MPEVRPIDANALKKDLSEFNYGMALRIVDIQPTIDPEMRHGQWIQQESPYGRHYNCSECGHEVCVPCSEMIDPRDHVCYLDDYCGKCGTRMDSTDTNVDDKGGVDNDT